MKVFSFSYEKRLGHHEFDYLIRRASSFGSEYCQSLRLYLRHEHS